MKISNFEQRSPEWIQERRGLPTASMFGKLLTPATCKLSKSADDYIHQLLGERFGVFKMDDDRKSAAMQNGIDTEAEARDFYAMEKGVDVQQVGFCLSDCGRFGCSPDGLVGDDGGCELKCPTDKVHVRYLLAGTLPDDYKAQVHGSLIVTGRQWWDFMSYCPGLPPLILRVVPDEYTDALRKALDVFHEKYEDAAKRLIELGAIEPVETSVGSATLEAECDIMEETVALCG